MVSLTAHNFRNGRREWYFPRYTPVVIRAIGYFKDKEVRAGNQITVTRNYSITGNQL
jgi:hypothetical protein